MKLYLFKSILPLLLIFLAANANAETISVEPDSTGTTRYEKKVERYCRHWDALIPKQLILQYAGNMGVMSAGVGWNYGKHNQWETQFMLGYLNRYGTRRPKMTVTLKQNFIPWRVTLHNNWMLEPFECGVYFNSILGEEFWNKQPKKYPKKYYWFSTKIRPNLFIGQRITKKIPHDKRHFIKSCTFFYELSSPEIYLMEWYNNSYLKLSDVFSLSLGVKVQIM